MAKSMFSINLLPDKGNMLMSQFLNWSLTIGRLLIIIVETLALGTFLYRFSLDWQISDLKDKIKIQRSIVTSYKSQEDNFRNLQTRLSLIKKYDELSGENPQLLSDLIEMGKGYITFKNIYVSTTVIRIEAQSNNASSISYFVESLKKHPRINSINIDKVENKTSSSEVIIGISAYLNRTDIPEKPVAQKINESP